MGRSEALETSFGARELEERSAQYEIHPFARASTCPLPGVEDARARVYATQSQLVVMLPRRPSSQATRQSRWRTINCQCIVGQLFANENVWHNLNFDVLCCSLNNLTNMTFKFSTCSTCLIVLPTFFQQIFDRQFSTESCHLDLTCSPLKTMPHAICA